MTSPLLPTSSTTSASGISFWFGRQNGSALILTSVFLKTLDEYISAPSRPYELAFLLEPSRYLYDLLLRPLDLGELHRALRLHVFSQHLGGPLGHVLQELVLYRLVRALEREAQYVRRDLLYDELQAPVVHAHEVGEYEHLLLYAHGEVRGGPLYDVYDVALRRRIDLVQYLGRELYALYGSPLVRFGREHLLAYQ